MLENPEFEQSFCSRTAECKYINEHDSIRWMKWLAYYDRSYYVNINYYGLKGSALKYLNEIS